jgi:hypothetical protein
MKSLGRDETELIGEWEFVENRRLEDDVCRRIRTLVSTELEYVAADTSGRHKLYRDPFDQRLWELAEGPTVPPKLRLITTEQARERYNV